MTESLGARPEPKGRISAGRPDHDAAGAGAGRVDDARTKRERAAATAAGRPVVVPVWLFTSHRVRALAAAVREGTVPVPDPDPPLTPLGTEGKAVFGRACSQCHGGPGQSTPQATPHAPRAGSAISSRLDSVPAPGGHHHSGPVRPCGLPAALAGMREPMRLRCRCRREPDGLSPPGPRSAGQLRPRARPAYRVRRRPRAWTTGTSSTFPGFARSPDRAVFPQQQRRHARGRGRPLHRVLQVRAGQRRAGCPHPTDHVNRRCALRLATNARGALGAHCVSAKAVAAFHFA